MPPRAARAPKKSSVMVAVKKNLMAAPPTRASTKDKDRAAPTTSNVHAARSRVSRRKQEITPQEAPEWQLQALKTVAAAAKRCRKNSSKRSAASSVSGAGSHKHKKTKGAASTARKNKGGEKDEEEDESALSASSDEDNTASAACEAGSETSAGTVHRRATKEASAKRPRKAAAGTVATGNGAPNKRSKKPKAADLQCPRCKLRVDQWPFCGLSGDSHV
ncbi:hypothetical protein ABL78_4909 [Leptomonas seymouri]|uniref:Uncharacterized protein n=1 Tax=Leptomonas seymouri TaxID=5684 RepID=A0A0N1IJU8_LEPSE|nr:hypothetical protein ABL78_4909 [Leptomonas seymouri]|eukprot:KPI86040.1 hypothetical protein ABL78_4909 [Leptomonas seymouri]